MKKYTAKTDVSVKVNMPSGQSVRVSFAPMTGGGSVFYTDDAEIQNALESHYRFGSLFILSDDEPFEENAYSPEVSPETEETEIQEVHVSDLGEAKDFLAEKHGINRTKMKSKEAIVKTASSLGVVFIFD